MAVACQGEHSQKAQGENALSSKRPVPVSSLALAPQHPQDRLKALQQALGNQGVLGRLQAKLAINEPGDAYEQEADRAAEAVMSQPNANSTGILSVTGAGASARVQRKCAACEEEEEKIQVQRKESPAASQPAVVPSIVGQVLNSTGQPLDAAARTFFEPRFGYDFGGVRVHADSRAGQSARAVNALAYTVGRDVVFDHGRYEPGQNEGRRLLAHELAHVVQQGRTRIEQAREVSEQESEHEAENAAHEILGGQSQESLSPNHLHLARKPSVAASRSSLPLNEKIKRIDSLLSYGLLDWAITDKEAIESFQILRDMTNEERVVVLPRIRIDRLIDNLPRRYQPELAILLVSGANRAAVFAQLWRLLSSFLFDWFVSADDAVAALRLLQALRADERDYAFDLLGADRRRRLWKKLPESERAFADQLWQEKNQRIMERQLKAFQPVIAGPSTEEPVEKKRREFADWVRPIGDRGSLSVLIRYYDWIEKHAQDPEYLIITPAALYDRMSKEVQSAHESAEAAMQAAKEKGLIAAEETKKQFEKWKQFDDFFHARLKALDEMNDTEASVQREILKRFTQWMDQNHNSPGFLKADPLRVYEQLGKGVVTLEVDRALMRAASAPQDEVARQKKFEEFMALAQRLRDYRNRFPYLIPVPSEHRDLLVEGDAMAVVFDLLSKELRDWALVHMLDGDYTTVSPISVLSALAAKHEDLLKQAQLIPLVFESIARTDLDWGVVAKSFVSTLAKVLVGVAIIGFVIGAEILTAGQVTWILLGLAAAMGAKAYHDRREEIQNTNADVPPSATVVHAAGDVIGLSQFIEGSTGLRLGTEQRLASEERSEELGEGSASIAALFLGSRSFKGGRSAGAAWKASAPLVGGKIAPAALLPGPAEHFPFGSGKEPLWVPESPNKIYRIMSMEEAAQALKSGKLPSGAKGTMGSKFLSLDSKYAMLFREKTLAEIAKVGEGVAKAEANLKVLESRLADVEAAGDQAAAAKLRANAAKLRSEIAQRVESNKAASEPVLKDWLQAPGQKVVVEIDLEPGSIEHMLNRAVEERLLNQYEGKDVFIWKFERGYGRNLAVPPWQVDKFNNLVKGIRLYAGRGLNIVGPAEIPKGVN